MTSRCGEGYTDDLKAAEVLGAEGQLHKPFTAHDLIGAVGKTLTS